MMASFEYRKPYFGYFAAIVVILLFVCGIVNADDTKKTPLPVPKSVPQKLPMPKVSGNPTNHTQTGQGSPNGTHGSTKQLPRPNTNLNGTPRKEPRSPLTKPGIEIHTKGGSVVKHSDGRVADVWDTKRGINIHNTLDGRRRIEIRREEYHMSAERGRPSFVERPYVFGRREYWHRTYYYHGHAYDRFYYGYRYRDAPLEMYVPAYYYAPAFYGWVYYPWASPVRYTWGWVGDPWYGYYAAYFSPYAVYSGPSLWLTDYLISTSLAEAYQAQADAALAVQQWANAEGGSPLTPEIKDLVAAEVQRQMRIENAESTGQASDPNQAMSGIEALLEDNSRHVFVAVVSIDAIEASGAECLISEGDTLQSIGAPGANATSASLIVLSSRGGQECHVGSTVSVELADLQDMQNHMREIIDQGMNELQTQQGRNGLPPLPASAAVPPTKAAFAADAPGPDPSAEKEITEQSEEADQTEKEMLSQAGASGQSPETGLGESSGRTSRRDLMETKVREIIGFMASDQFEQVRAMYARSMPPRLTAETLRNNWNGKIRVFGSFRRVLSVEKDQNRDVVAAYCAFAAGQIRVEVAFDPSISQITGIYVVPATEPRRL